MINFQFEKFESVDSTNDYLIREINANKITKDKIIVSREQTNGHGSYERKFLSPNNTGIYFSFLHIYEEKEELSYITQKVAVAVYKTFKKIFNIELTIKWINDLYYNNKKVCGILCKNIIAHNMVIIGVGINLFYNEKLIGELKDVAGTIFINKKDLIDNLKNGGLNKESCLFKNIYDDFKTIDIEAIDINDDNLWEPDHIVIEIVMEVLSLIKTKGLPKLYIEKNMVKDEKNL